MATWLAVNIVLSAIIFAAMVGIPLWMVIKHPDTGEAIAETTARVQAIPLHAVSREEVARWREAA
jgi:ABC-type proline/glycine betaine transport system permease subunit